jgi:hypothetical protein
VIDTIQVLADQPGVDLVMLLSDVGVPIATVRGSARNDAAGENDPEVASKDDALAAMAAGWLNDLRLAVGPLSWEEPTRIVMRCARGVLVMRRTRGAVLLVRLVRGLSPEDVRLPMEGVVKRIERSLSGMGRRGTSSGSRSYTQPRGPIPSVDLVDQGEGLTDNTGMREDLAGM